MSNLNKPAIRNTGNITMNRRCSFRTGYLISILITMPLFFCLKGPEVSSTPGNQLPGEIVELDSSSFDTIIVVNDRIAVVDFYLPGCLACLAMDSIFTHLAVLYRDQVCFARVNCNVNSMHAVEYMTDSMLSAVPTFIFYKNGETIKHIVGVVPENTLAAVIDSLLES
jgi:thioredoxin 1